MSWSSKKRHSFATTRTIINLLTMRLLINPTSDISLYHILRSCITIDSMIGRQSQNMLAFQKKTRSRRQESISCRQFWMMRSQFIRYTLKMVEIQITARREEIGGKSFLLDVSKGNRRSVVVQPVPSPSRREQVLFCFFFSPIFLELLQDNACVCKQQYGQTRRAVDLL